MNNSSLEPSEAKITQTELLEIFGESIPMEAVALIVDGPGDMTIDQYRKKLREIASKNLGTFQRTYRLVLTDDPPIVGEYRYVVELVPDPTEPLASMIDLPAKRVVWDGFKWRGAP